MLESVDLSSLTSRGDCDLHFHHSDRFPTRDTMLWMQSLERVKTISANYTLTANDDILLVDTAGVTITLPPSKNGRHYRVINYYSGAGDVTIDGDGSETVNGSATYTVTGSFGTCHLKAISGGWVVM